MTDATLAGPDNGVPSCIAFYTTADRYAGFACADSDGNYVSATGLPDGEYLASNQFRITTGYAPVDFGFLPQAWTNDGSFGECGEPCDFLLGDTFTISGGVVLEGSIDLTMERGATIQGRVTTAGSVPLAGVEMRLLNGTDASLVRAEYTDNFGDYVFEGVGSGTYHLRTVNNQGYEDQLFALPVNLSCTPFCDALSGESIVLGASDELLLDYDLLPTPTIQGQVSNHLGAQVGGVKVAAYDSLGSKVASATTTVSGHYTLANLWAGTFYVRTENTSGYVDALWSGKSCPTGCDPTTGNAINLASGTSQAGINLQMAAAAEITGTVSNGGSPLAGVTMELYRDTGAFVKSATSNGAGAFTLGGLAAGNYHVVSRNSFGYIDEGAAGTVCQAGCNPVTTGVVPVPLNGSVDRNFALDLGGQVSGNVYDAGVTALPNVTVAAYNSAGAQIRTTVNNAAGQYLL
jgi:hypothetical protein